MARRFFSSFSYVTNLAYLVRLRKPVLGQKLLVKKKPFQSSRAEVIEINDSDSD